MRLALTSLVLLLPLVSTAGTDSLRQTTPFSAPAPAKAEAPSAGLATLELVGIAVIGQEPQFGIRDIGTQRTSWLTLNREQDGLTVVKYDSHHNTATVQGRGGSRLLVLKTETIVSAPPAPNSAPVGVSYSPTQPRPAQANVAARAPQPLPQPEPIPANLTPEQRKQRQAETEARMLVSDLMEISMQERARYAEEQRRRTAGQSTPAPAPSPTNPPQK